MTAPRASDVPAPMRRICQRLRAAGHGAYVVGGCVRDLLLGRSAADWDVATSALPEAVQALFHRSIPTGLKHGTITVLDGDTQVEVTTFRSEGAYADGRHPDRVTFGVTLDEDLARRDFTVNALAFDPETERLVDPHGGQRDLAARLLRAVGDPVARLCEDGLRVMRAARFAATLEFELDPATEAAIPAALGSLARVSQERVRDELVKLLGARTPSRGLGILARSGALAVILPELAEGIGQVQNRYHHHDVWTHTMATVDATPAGDPPDPVRRLSALLHDVAKPRTAAPREDAPGEFTFYRHDLVGAELSETILRRLRVSNRDRERVVAVVAHHMFWYTPEWTDSAVRRFVAKVGEGLLPDLFALREGDVVGRGRGEDPDVELGELRARIGRVLEEDQALTVGDLAIKGGDVITALALRPGPVVGELLRALLELVLEDPSLNDRDRLLALLPEVHANGLTNLHATRAKNLP